MMRRPILVLVLTMLGAGRLTAQNGAYLTVGTDGPELGLVRPIGRHLALEPGIYLSIDNSDQRTDSLRQRSRFVEPGLALALRWTRSRQAMISPMAGLRVSVGRQWVHDMFDFVLPLGFTESLSQKQVNTTWSAAFSLGVQARLSDRASFSAEYLVREEWGLGTETDSTTFAGGVFPPAPTGSRSTVKRSALLNTFRWTLRVYRRGRARRAVEGITG